jgi:NCS1 family nucleobase:cation symporter-1
VLVIAMLALCIATLATNIAANVVSPANDFSNLAPHRISFRTGGLITGVIGILMMPWKLIANPKIYIFTWLGGYGALLGPIGGILIADYFVLRRCRLHVEALYETDGEYRYSAGVSWIAIFSLAAAVLPSLPGFLAEVHLISGAGLPPALLHIYDYAWFAGFAIAFVLYLALRAATARSRTVAPQPLLNP